MARLKKVFIYLGLFLLFLELASRFYLFGFDAFNYFKVNSFNSVETSGLIQPATHAEIIYEWKPNLDTYFKMARFKTNSQGLRDKEYSLKKPPNTFRVAVLGPSSTVPAGVNIEDAFHSLIEERLNRESSGMNYEFINFSGTGYGTRQSLATLKYKVISYDPDLVFLNLPGTRIWERKNYSRPYIIRPRTYPFFESFFLKLIGSIGTGKSRANSYAWDKDSLDAVFSEFNKVGEIKDIPIFVFFFDRPSGMLKELALKYSPHFIIKEETFDYRAFGRKFCNSPLECSPNAAAHKIFADSIYEALQKSGALKVKSERS